MLSMCRTWRTVKLSLVLLVLVVATACSSGTSTTTSPSTSSSAGSKPAAPSSSEPKKEEAKAQKTYKIAVLLPRSTGALFMAMTDGVKDKAKELGVNADIFYAEEDVKKQLEQIDDAITRRVDALLISPISFQGLVPGYEKARDAKIPAYSIARTIENPQLEKALIGLKSYVTPGRMIGEWLAKETNGKGKVALLSGKAGTLFAVQLAQGVKEVLAKYPDIKIVAEYHSEHTPEEGLKLAEDVLVAHPDIRAIVAAQDELALGAASAVEAANKKGSVLITGMNGAPPGFNAVKEGKISLTLGLAPYKWGRLGIETVVKGLNGATIPYEVINELVVVDYKNIGQMTLDDIR